MDMSLDDIISSGKRRGGGRGRGRGGAGAARGGRGGTRTGGQRTGGLTRRGGVGGGASTRGAFTNRRRQSGGNAEGVWTHDKFQESSLGGARKPVVTGPAKITISNLHYGVSDADIIELFSELGTIRYASVHYDRSGRSMGKADVTFERRAEAQAAIQQYNGVPLDGRSMSITWANAAPTTTTQVSPRGSGLRQIQGKRISRTGGGGGVGGGAKRGLRGGVRGRGRGAGAGAGRQKTKAPTAEELDAELDAYVSQNPK